MNPPVCRRPALRVAAVRGETERSVGPRCAAGIGETATHAGRIDLGLRKVAFPASDNYRFITASTFLVRGGVPGA